MEQRTVYEMFERSAGFFPQKTALVFEYNDSGRITESFTYKRLFQRITAMARGLLLQEVKAGDMVCVCLPNSPDFVAAYFALSKIGAISVLLNPALPEERIKKVVADTGAKLLLTAESVRRPLLMSHRPEAKCLPDAAVKRDGGETSVVLYSSGTTGEQKGVELAASNLYHNIRYTSMLTGMTPKDRLICFVPLTHCFGLNFIMGACFYTGATLVLHKKFDLEQILESLVENRVTMFFAVPAVYNMMLKDGVDQFYFSSVRYFFYAADSMSLDSLVAWEEEYGRKIYTGWGLTETSPFATSNHESIYRLGSVGKPIPGVKIKITEPVKGGKGEICVRGHNVMKGYLNGPEETAGAVDKDGWFHTGDIGIIDGDGYLYIVDRLKDMINVGGEKAWPAEIERIILRHPKVADVAVVGIPHDIMGEVPKAFVVKKDDSLTAEELREFIKPPKLMKHEFLREIEFTEKIPRNPSGKILRRELRDK